jgi:transposase
VALRSRIVLLIDNGLSIHEVSRQLGIARHTVRLWRQRYSEGGCASLTRDKPGRGRKPSR